MPKSPHVMIIIIFILLSIILFQCAQTRVIGNGIIQGERFRTEVGDVVKVDLQEEGVTCFLYDHAYRGGISCMPSTVPTGTP